jgi:hypothetical protein
MKDFSEGLPGSWSIDDQLSVGFGLRVGLGGQMAVMQEGCQFSIVAYVYGNPVF